VWAKNGPEAAFLLTDQGDLQTGRAIPVACKGNLRGVCKNDLFRWQNTSHNEICIFLKTLPVVA
jgi:hypothetical protein